MLRIEKTNSLQGLIQLEPVWNSLLAESASNTIALTWEWVTTWWETFQEGRELYVLVVRDGHEVVGIAPLLKHATRYHRLLPCRRLEFIGSGESEADEICSEYLDFIVRRGREPEVLEALVEYLLDGAEEWDELLLTDVAEASINVGILKAMCEQRKASLEVTARQESFYLSLPDDWDSFIASCSGGIRRRIQRDRRSLPHSRGKLRIVDSIDGFTESFDLLIELHQSRWNGRNRPGVFASNKFTRFHRLIAPKLLARQWLKLFVLYADDRPVSALYAFVYNKRMHYYQSGFASGQGSMLSPGTLVHSYAIEDAIHKNLLEYDFLKGDAGGHKASWGADRRNVIQLRLGRPGSRETLFYATNLIAGGLRGLKRALQNAAAL